jgi:hypothetical protein
MDLGEIGWGGVEWIHLAQDRDRWRAVVNTVTKLGVLWPGSYLYYGGGQVFVTDQGCRNNVLVRVENSIKHVILIINL